jgi:hypothetical protein
MKKVLFAMGNVEEDALTISVSAREGAKKLLSRRIKQPMMITTDCGLYLDI